MKILLIMNCISMTFGWTATRTFSRAKHVLTFGQRDPRRPSTMMPAAASSSTSTPRSATTTTLPPIPENAHRIVLMRHGESEFNNANIFTGWCDVALTQSIVTSHRSLEAAGVAYTPIQYDWRLNERHYGALQGLSKERTADRLGRELVMRWRRSYDARPPPMHPEHPHFDIINNDPRYRKVPDIPLGESLEDCQKRVVVAWNDIVADFGKDDVDDHYESDYSLLVAHANTLRALVMHLDSIEVDDIEDLNIPTAIPFYYDIDKTTGKVISHMADDDDAVARFDRIGTGKFRGIYISDERKKRSFLERRRAANDPWLWALHDHQVARSMLVGGVEEDQGTPEGLVGLEEEAKQNTELFSSALKKE